MKPIILTDPDEPRLSWLVDEHSESTLFEETTGEHLKHYETAIAIQDLVPGMFRFQFCRSLGLLDEEHALADLNCETSHPTAKIVELWRLRYCAPWICVFAIKNAHIRSTFEQEKIGLPADFNPWDTKARARFDREAEKRPKKCHGIYEQAAVVMLRLAASFNNVKTDGVKRSFAFGEHRIEKVEPSLPWSEGAFLTAWLFSDWERRSEKKKLTLAQRFDEMQAIGYGGGIKAFEALHRKLFPKPMHSPASR
jgi:hypothetical protein